MGGKVGIGRGGATSKVAPAFVFRAHDFAHRRDRTAFGFERTHVAVELACAIEDKAVGIDVGACGCEVAMLRFEYLAAWTDIAITLFVEREISAFERAPGAWNGRTGGCSVRLGSQLLKQSVLLFLQARDNINKDIHNTLDNDPEMFFRI